jgi:radical SAM superfamily enzyme
MPLGNGFYGTQKDGSDSAEYCTFCYQSGSFTNPALTLQGMIDLSTKHMMSELKFDETRAHELASSVIPTLKRWQ